MARVTSQGVKISESVTYTITNRSEVRTGNKIPFNKIYSKTSKNNFFKIDGNDILFLKDCTILVNFCIPMSCFATRVWLRLVKNNSVVATTILATNNPSFMTFSISPKMLNMAKNDRLSVIVQNFEPSSGYGVVGESLDNIDGVYLTVQKIN